MFYISSLFMAHNSFPDHFDRILSSMGQLRNSIAVTELIDISVLSNISMENYNSVFMMF